MLHSGNGGGLVEAPEFDVCGHPRSDIERVENTVGATRDWEQGVINDILREEGLSNGLRNIGASLFIETLASKKISVGGLLENL